MRPAPPSGFAQHLQLRRIVQSMGANTYAQVVTVFGQLLLVPLFLSYVGAHEYGHWVIYTTVFSYLGVADLGVYVAGGNGMTMALAAQKPDQAGRMYDAILRSSAITVPAVAIVCIAVTWLTPELSGRPDGWALALLFAVAGTFATWAGVAEACYRATGLASRGTLASSHVKTLELLGTVAGLVLGGSLLAAAIGQLLGRLVPQTIMIVLGHRVLMAQGVVRSRASWTETREVARQSMGSLQCQISNMLAISLANFFVLTQLGAEKVAVLNAHRVLARSLMQVGTIMGKSLAPEVSHLFGRRDVDRIQRLTRHSALVVLGGLAVAALLLWVAGPQLFGLLSHGQLAFQPAFFAVLLMASAATACGFLYLTMLQAVNQVLVLGSLSLLCTGLLGACLVLVTPSSADGLMFLGTALVVYECTLLLIAFALFQRLVRNRLCDRPAF